MTRGPRKSEGAGKVFAPTPARLERTNNGREPGAHVSSHGGREIEPRLRAPFEARLAHDFAAVRIHDDAEAAAMARDNRAQAVTVGSDVYFGPGRFAPQSPAGTELLGHELAHVAQQERGGDAHDAERRADQAADSLTRGQAVSPDALGGAPLSAQAKPEPDVSGGRAPPRQAGPGEHFASAIDRFGFDSDALTADHLKAIDSLAFSIALHTKQLASGKAAIAIIGHTDTAGSEPYNQGLGQRRADKTKVALQNALKMHGLTEAQIASITASSAGETHPTVATKDNVREPRNRRVEIQVTITSAASTAPPARPPIDLFHPPPDSTPSRVNPLLVPPTPSLPGPSREWLQNHFENDPLLRSLPKFAREQLITALKDVDELGATQIIGSLNLGDKTAAVTAAVKALLQLIKGRKYTPPPTPPVLPDFGPARAPPKMPGEKIFTLPPINLPKPFN
jgi:outer membrane protein OmpA-like peptidoglycan-associated protein